MLDLKINYSSRDFEGFEPIDEDNVLLSIVDFNLSQYDTDQLEAKFIINSGSKKRFYVYDYIHFVPYKSTSWKLPKLLDSVGKNCDGILDFNDLIGKSLVASLRRTERSGKFYQNILYQPCNTKYDDIVLGNVIKGKSIDDNLPF